MEEDLFLSVLCKYGIKCKKTDETDVTSPNLERFCFFRIKNDETYKNPLIFASRFIRALLILNIKSWRNLML